MKTLVLLAVIALSVYYYIQTHRPEPPPPEPVVAAQPTPRKAFYHSPLDAPAMQTGTHSGGGYVSKNQGTNWRGSHLSDGAAPRTSVPDAPASDSDQ